MFNLEGYLKQRRKIVDKAIDDIMPPARMRPVLLHKAMRYAAFSGGKRLRPILCLAAAEAVGAPHRCALAPAVALELLHTYTLVHDDLPCMDDDALRRGKPTCHVVFGEANAVLAGDALQALAFSVLASTPVHPPYTAAQLIQELATAAGSTGVVGGQVEDLAADSGPMTLQRVEFIHQHKTADLFRAALRLGAMAGNAPRDLLSALTHHGADLGIAFQITDDLLDAAPAGKPEQAKGRGRQGAKARKEGMTCLSVYTADEARREADRRIAAAIASLHACNPALVEPLIAIARFVDERRS